MFSLYHRVSSCILESFAARRARIFYTTPLNDATPEVSGTVVVQNFADLTGIDYAGPRIVAPQTIDPQKITLSNLSSGRCSKAVATRWVPKL